MIKYFLITTFVSNLSCEELPTKPNEMIYDARRPSLAAEVTYRGKIQKIDATKNEMCIRHAIATDEQQKFNQLFDEEIQVDEGGKAYWVPIQRQIAKDLKAEIMPGDALLVFVKYLGSCFIKKNETVFLMTDFQKGTKVKYYSMVGELNLN